MLELSAQAPLAFLGSGKLGLQELNFRHKLIVRLGRGGNRDGHVLLGKNQEPLVLLFELGDSTKKQF